MEPTDVAIIGAGPGGYAAAFYAADKGLRVVLIDEAQRLGGVCLNHGCIPSKALLHATQLIRDAATANTTGITFAPAAIEPLRLNAWKESVLDTLAQGIDQLAQRRKIQIIQGRAQFDTSQQVRVETATGSQTLQYEHAIIAVGSTPALPKTFALRDPRIMTSTEALAITQIPQQLLVIGGGYIGLELATVYASLGSRVVLVEALEAVLSGVDADLVRPVLRSAQRSLQEIRVNTKVVSLTATPQHVQVVMEQDGRRIEESYERVLVAVGRVPNCDRLGLEQTRVIRNEQGFIVVNNRQQTADPSLYAIGDIVGPPLLAHKASKEARIAVDAITGQAPPAEEAVIPAVVFTDPEIAWCGLTETEAATRGVSVRVVRFPWSASGRAVSMGRTDGMTKLLIEPTTERLLGVGIVGAGAGELIGEGVLAVQTGVTARQLAQTVHPHPTLSETLKECAEMFYGISTHALARKPG